MHCKDCKSWYRHPNSDYGTCNSEKFVEDGWDYPIDNSSLIFGTEYELAYLKTGENFGCVHFKSKT